MGLSKHSLALTCFITLALALFRSSHAQNSPQDYVDAHNAARTAVGVGNIVWDTTVAAYAQNYANQRIGDCALVLSTGGNYSESLAKGSSSAFTGVVAVNGWVAENQFYNYATNTCATGKVCGHYTQVVWSNSVKLGCARVQCTNGWYFVVCEYYPKGNIVGERPY